MNVLDQYLSTRHQLFEHAGIFPESRTVRTDGPVRNIHYLKAGSGDPLILIHGGGSHSAEFFGILRPLAGSHTLYVVDRPGSGQTDFFNYRGVDVPGHAVSFIRSFMKAAGLKKASFLAQSMGAYFAIWFAMKHPDMVGKLILIGAPAGVNRWIPLPMRMMGIRNLNMVMKNTIMRPSVKSVRSLYRNLFVADVSRVPGIYLEHVYYHQLLPGRLFSWFTLAENLLTVRQWKPDLYIGDRLDRLQVPVRLIWGTKDAFEKPETGFPKASAIRDVRMDTVEDAGHCPWFDKPGECVRLIHAAMDEKHHVEARPVYP